MDDGSLVSLWLVSNNDDESRLGCLMMEYVLLDSFRRFPPIEDNDWEVGLAGEIPRFTVSVPNKMSGFSVRDVQFAFGIYEWTIYCTENKFSNLYFHAKLGLVLPDPDPELVEMELLPGEGVPGSGDRARAAESAETAN